MIPDGVSDAVRSAYGCYIEYRTTVSYCQYALNSAAGPAMRVLKNGTYGILYQAQH